LLVVKQPVYRRDGIKEKVVILLAHMDAPPLLQIQDQVEFD